jgi:hypothetical protein
VKPRRYFFFSYARENRRNAQRERPDGLSFNIVDQFFDRLCKCLSGVTGRSAQEVGYRDISALHVSAPWPEDLVEAMHDSQVLIALGSPHYFASLNCGREFQVFVERFNRLKQGTNHVGIDSPIIPLFWENIDYCWKHASTDTRCFIEGFQLTGPGFPEDYPSVGLLRQLLLGTPQTYDAICFYLADRIKALAEREPPLPALNGVSDFRELVSAFDHEQTGDKTVEPIPVPIFNLGDMRPGVAGGPAPPALHLAS